MPIALLRQNKPFRLLYLGHAQILRRITAVDDMIQIMTVGSQLHSSLSLLARQSMLMLTELPEMVTVFEPFFRLEYSESYTCNMHADARIEGYHYCMPLETLLSLNYNSFILTVGIIGGDSHARDIYGNSHSQDTCVLLEIPSMHKLVQCFQSLHTCRNEDIYELKGVHIATIKADLCSSNVEYCSISNVNSLYQCCCKQCCGIAVYAMCYSVINPCGHWTSGTLSALASNGNTLYNVMGVKRHMPVDLPHFWQKRIFVSTFFSVQSSFDGKQYVCKTCHLIQTFSINTSVPLLTAFDSITNIQ